MNILFHPAKTPDRVLQAEIGGKLAHAALHPCDFPEAFQLFAQMANNHQMIRSEIARMAQSYQFDIGGERYGIWFAEGGCYACQGIPNDPAGVFRISAENALKLAHGMMSPVAARQGGFLDYTGPQEDAIALRRVFELFLGQFLPARTSVCAEDDIADKLKFGIAGADAFQWLDQKHDLIAFTALYDNDTETAEAMAKRHGCEAFETLEAMLGSGVDAVFVGGPPAEREEIAMQCARAGKHVLCEAPLSVTPESCKRMAAACEENHVKLMEADLQRFLPAHHYMRKIVKSGLIGDVLMARAYEGLNGIADFSLEGGWKGDPVLGGGGVLAAANKFAVLEYILQSECMEVTAMLGRQGVALPEKAEDSAIAVARFEDGAMVDIAVTFAQQTAASASMEIIGSRGTILEDHAWANPVRFCSNDPRMGEDLQKWVEPEIEHAAFPEYRAIAMREVCGHFARCISGGYALDFTPAQSARAAACILAAYHSAQEGRPIALSEIETLTREGRTDGILRNLAAAIPMKGELPRRGLAFCIQPLPQEEWQGYELKFSYETSHYYDVEIMEFEEGLGVAFTKRPFAEPLMKSSAVDRLYMPHWIGAQAYGIIENEELIACIELCKEEWSNRMRVTELWVAENHRRQGLGKALMNFAKQQAQELGCRALMLETQSCNEAAIAFYQAQGLTLFGFDRSCYSNQDVENHEVRIELGVVFHS